jgi:hypothetical protein
MAMAKAEARTRKKTETGAVCGAKAKTKAKACPAAKAAAKARAGVAGKTADDAPARAVREVKREIVAKFPEMKGVRPSVVRRKVPAEKGVLELIGQIDGELGARLAGVKGRVAARDIYCASFEKETTTERGTVLRRIVRVTFDREGNILKLVSSK